MDKAYNRLPTERSRELRNNATPAERKLWTVLSNRRLAGTRFNRQVPIGPFICDLVARSARLVIELDGSQHAEAMDYDQARTQFLEARGYRVLRFGNHEVLENIEGVAAAIVEALRHSPSRQSGRGRAAAGCEGEGLSEESKTMPSPPALRASSPPAPAGGDQ